MIRFDNLPPEVMQAMCTPMHQILPPSPAANTGGLFVGSMAALMDKELLRENHITHVVQVHEITWLPQDRDFHYYRIDIVDAKEADLKPHLEGVCDHIDQVLRSGRSVLVHCQQGVSRSPAVVIAYLIRNHGMTFDNAHGLLKRKRACINPNSGFVKILRDWESTWKRPTAIRRFTT
ncbi:phosphatases II [Pluteus cervinus]|uniref:Phosphatases II n=1 Tax=Pluteus cervinus TaxID=181527 RepID=A0ACD3AAN6_9AGAR|nr:phosphatases II [Pluteus cervinus]